MTAVSSPAVKARTGTVSEVEVGGTLKTETVGGAVSTGGSVIVTEAATPVETLPARSLA